MAVPAWPETPSERDGAWSDLITKLKTLILENFRYQVLTDFTKRNEKFVLAIKLHARYKSWNEFIESVQIFVMEHSKDVLDEIVGTL